MLGVNRQFFYKMMKERGRFLNLNMLQTKELRPWSNSLNVSVRELVQGWWTLETTISLNKKDVICMHKGVKKYITQPQHYLQESQVALVFPLSNLLSSFVLEIIREWDDL
jgi:hypothetical protein